MIKKRDGFTEIISTLDLISARQNEIKKLHTSQRQVENQDTTALDGDVELF